MKKAIVRYWMVEEPNGGFTTGISRKGEFTEDEIRQGKYEELIKDVKLIDGCYWSFRIEWL